MANYYNTGSPNQISGTQLAMLRLQAQQNENEAKRQLPLQIMQGIGMVAGAYNDYRKTNIAEKTASAQSKTADANARLADARLQSEQFAQGEILAGKSALHRSDLGETLTAEEMVSLSSYMNAAHLNETDKDFIMAKLRSQSTLAGAGGTPGTALTQIGGVLDTGKKEKTPDMTGLPAVGNPGPGPGDLEVESPGPVVPMDSNSSAGRRRAQQTRYSAEGTSGALVANPPIAKVNIPDSNSSAIAGASTQSGGPGALNKLRANLRSPDYVPAGARIVALASKDKITFSADEELAYRRWLGTTTARGDDFFKDNQTYDSRRYFHNALYTKQETRSPAESQATYRLRRGLAVPTQDLSSGEHTYRVIKVY